MFCVKVDDFFGKTTKFETISQCAFLQDLFDFLRFPMFFSQFPELFKNMCVDLQIMKI